MLLNFAQKKGVLKLVSLLGSKEDQIILSIADNGIGIDLEKYQDKIFGLYQRFHLHREGKGIGLILG